MKQKETMKKIVKNKITEHFQKLPVKERERLEKEDMRQKRKELEIIKDELWSYRGKESKQVKTTIVHKGENRKLRKRLEEIIEIKARIKREEDIEKERKLKHEAKMKELQER